MNLSEASGIAVAPLSSTYRDRFPVTERLIYLNHAAISPLCRPAADAMRKLVDDACSFGSLHYGEWLQAYDGLRRATARMLNCSPSEIAIVKNTSEGIATVALGMKWEAGDRVIAFSEEFPANYFPWKRLEDRGVEVTWLSIFDLDRIAREIPGAKLLAISHVNYLNGYRVDLQTIGRLCREHGCFFFVDAIQGMGALPIDVEASCIDALAADGHKWMLGPEGNGILYVRRSRLDEIEPVEFGWTNPAQFNDYSSRDMTLRPDAGRYECGTLNTVGCYGQRAALEFLLEVGIGNISKTVLSLADQVEAGLRSRGHQIMLQRTPSTSSGIVSFRHPALDANRLVGDLRRKGIAAAQRQGWVRVSPHFYISPGDIDDFLRAIPDI